MPVTISCIICEKAFSVKPSSKGKCKTCSKPCKSVYLSSLKDGLKNGTAELRRCKICDREFKIHKSALKHRSGDCCSVNCLTQYRRNKIDNKEVVRLYKSGLSIYEVAKIFGVSGGGIQGRLKQENVPRRTGKELMTGEKNPMYKKTHTPEAVAKIKAANIKQFSSLEARERHGILTAKQIESGRTGKKNNTLETELERLMIENLVLNFEKQYRVGRYVFDFYIPSSNLLIEADGTFWHSDPRFYPNPDKLSFTQNKNLANDLKKNSFCETRGFNLLRIWEYDVFNNPVQVMEHIKNACQYTKHSNVSNFCQ